MDGAGDLLAQAKGSTIKLTHYGRKSGKPYTVTIWFVVIDGQVWIGSLDTNRGWVRNVRATGKAALDFGSGPIPVQCTWVDRAEDTMRFQDTVRAKYWILAPILSLFVRGERCAFKTSPAAA